MALIKGKLGQYIEAQSIQNAELKYGEKSVRGVNTSKQMMPTKADLTTRDLSKFQLVKPRWFFFNHRTSRNGDKFSITYNDTEDTVICTEDYVVFKIKDDAKTLLIEEWLYLFFNRPEFDRYVITNSWGSSTEFFNWEDICEVEIEIPDFYVQKKYVEVFKALVSNQQSYERGLDDLKLLCDGYIEELRRNMPSVKIGPYISACNEKNDNNAITLFQGVNVDHVFTDPKRIAEDAENGSVVRTGQFAFNKVMKANNTKLPIALREGPDCVVSNSYQVFEVSNKEKLLPKYLLLWMNRAETQRYAGFISFGTTRDIFTLEDMGEIEIPLPQIEIQQSISNIYATYQERSRINEKLKTQIKSLCPILIKGSIDEGAKQGGRG